MNTKIILTVERGKKQTERREWLFDTTRGECGRDKFQEVVAKLLNRNDILLDSNKAFLSENYFALPIADGRIIYGSFLILPS